MVCLLGADSCCVFVVCSLLTPRCCEQQSCKCLLRVILEQVKELYDSRPERWLALNSLILYTFLFPVPRSTHHGSTYAFQSHPR